MHTKPLSSTNPTTTPSCSYRLIGRNSNRMYQWREPIQRWSDQSEATLQDCFDHVDWNVIWSDSENNIALYNLYADLVSESMMKCIGDVVPTVTIKTQKPWMDGGICTQLKAWNTALNHGRGLEIWLNINSVVFPSSRQTHKPNAGTGTKWSCNSTAQTWDACGRIYRKITDYKYPSAHVRFLLGVVT